MAADKMLAANRRSTRLGGLFKGATWRKMDSISLFPSGTDFAGTADREA